MSAKQPIWDLRTVRLRGTCALWLSALCACDLGAEVAPPVPPPPLPVAVQPQPSPTVKTPIDSPASTTGPVAPVPGDSPLPEPRVTTKVVASYDEWNCDLGRFVRTIELWRDHDDVVIRWWAEATCEQRLTPVFGYSSPTISLSVRSGPRTKCGEEIRELYTRVSAPTTGAAYRLVVAEEEVPWVPTAEAPAHLMRPRCRKVAKGVNLDPWSPP